MLVPGVDDRDAADLGGTERMRGEDHRVFGEFDDVDLLAAQLANDGLHAHALHAYASAHAVHVAIPAHDGDFGALTGFARAAFDDHRVVVDLRNFLLEQPHHEFGRSTGHNHSRVLARLVHTADHATAAIAHTEIFQLALFFFEQTRFGLAQVDHQVLALDALHRAIDQFTHASGVFRKDGLAFGLAHFLQNHLLGGLRGDATQGLGGFGETNFRFQLSSRIHPLSVV